jgi:hypothetical protein
MGLILLILVVLFLCGGIGGRFYGDGSSYGYGYGHAPIGIGAIILIVVVLLLLSGRL